MKMNQYISSLVGLIIGLFAPTLLAADAQFNFRMHATFIKAQAKGLKAGMTAAVVEDILGKPDNADWSTAFVFRENSIRVWMCVQNKAGELASWRDYLKDSRSFGLGYFLIMKNGFLTLPSPLLTSKDAYVLSILAGDGHTKVLKLFPDQPDKP